MKKKLNLCFKGRRTYIHGTDIFNALLDMMPKDEEPSKLLFSIHKKFHTQPIVTDETVKNEEVLFAIKAMYKNETLQLYGIDSHEQVACRYDYDEEWIVSLCDLSADQKEFTLEHASDYSFIENIVVMNKHLLQTLFSPSNKKWFFTKLQMHHLPSATKLPLSVVYHSDFNKTLFKSDILSGEKKKRVGSIYFNLV